MLDTLYRARVRFHPSDEVKLSRDCLLRLLPLADGIALLERQTPPGTLFSRPDAPARASRLPVKERARAALATALKTDPQAISDSAPQADLSELNSVRHMNVVLALENEFADTELPGLTSLPLLVSAIERHTAA